MIRPPPTSTLFPYTTLFRSSLITILDTCALTMVGLEGMCQYQAKMTFAIARHALVDLSQIFNAPPVLEQSYDRLPPGELMAMREQLRDNKFVLTDGDAADMELSRLRSLYEPYGIALARFLWIELPPWIKQGTIKDNWKTSACKQQQILAEKVAQEEHF